MVVAVVVVARRREVAVVLPVGVQPRHGTRLGVAIVVTTGLV